MQEGVEFQAPGQPAQDKDHNAGCKGAGSLWHGTAEYHGKRERGRSYHQQREPQRVLGTQHDGIQTVLEGGGGHLLFLDQAGQVIDHGDFLQINIYGGDAAHYADGGTIRALAGDHDACGGDKALGLFDSKGGQDSIDGVFHPVGLTAGFQNNLARIGGVFYNLLIIHNSYFL
ncbi:hypothetical protein SDC9_173249 [bioreactor metagenome]|uniref:Uncharacterized protein n=1 Tax=bioreactor metagenome TaxID=1076179 RepID=A0A645GQ87_9ZZZZ